MELAAALTTSLPYATFDRSVLVAALRPQAFMAVTRGETTPSSAKMNAGRDAVRGDAHRKAAPQLTVRSRTTLKLTMPCVSLGPSVPNFWASSSLTPTPFCSATTVAPALAYFRMQGSTAMLSERLQHSRMMSAVASRDVSVVNEALHTSDVIVALQPLLCCTDAPPADTAFNSSDPVGELRPIKDTRSPPAARVMPTAQPTAPAPTTAYSGAAIMVRGRVLFTREGGSRCRGVPFIF